MLQLLDILTEAKKCHCSEKGIRAIIKGLGAEVIDLQETGTQFTITIELKKAKFEKLEKAFDDKFADHLHTVTTCGTTQAFVNVWKN